jgi:ABC-type multidrug transport system ATPase subunit
VIAEGTPTELKAELGATVLEVGLSTTEDASRTAELVGVLGTHAPVVNGTVVEVTVDDGPTSAMAGLRALDQEGITPTTFTLREPSLDDVFLALTGRRAEDETEDTEDEDETRRRMFRRKAAAEAMPIATGELS